MKSLIKILLISICILSITPSFSPAKPPPTVSTASQVQPSSVFDITYVVYIWTPVSTLFNPRYIDQFEFKAGDVFSAYTTRRGELTGTWIESDLGNRTWFQAWVEREETSTTTTTPTETTTTTPLGQSTGTSRLIQPKANELKYDVNIWGISFNYTPPAPFNTFTFSTILGYGAYLGADAFFMGFANFPTEITCGSVSPSEAEQGDSLTVTIGCTNANFLSAGNIDVSFSGNNDITVSDPSVKNNNEITVSIQIDADAEISDRTVTVIIDGIAAPASTKFKVKENTN
jgi:hypothetical protein